MMLDVPPAEKHETGHTSGRRRISEKSLPSGRSTVGEDISTKREERPEAFALAKELASAITLKRCLSDLTAPGARSFKLEGDEVSCFSNSYSDKIYEMSFHYELVTTLSQLDELITASVDPTWPTDTWLHKSFEEKAQVLLAVRTRGARKPQGFIAYRRRTMVDSFEGSQLQFYYEIAIEYIFVTKRMRGKGLGSALIAPLVMDGESDVRYLAKRLNAARFKSMDIEPRITVEAEVHSLGASRLSNQVFNILSESGRDAFDEVPHNRFETSDMFESEIDY